MDNSSSESIGKNQSEVKKEKLAKKKARKEPTENPKKNKKKIGISVFIIGLIALVSGIVFLLINLLTPPMVRDAEFLVSIGKWQLQDDPSVVWDFTEIGKGKLTNNSYLNEYDFIWVIKDDKLEIETNWLYTLNDKYTYKVDQSKKTLTLNETIILTPLNQIDETQQENITE